MPGRRPAAGAAAARRLAAAGGFIGLAPVLRALVVCLLGAGWHLFGGWKSARAAPFESRWSLRSPSEVRTVSWPDVAAATPRSLEVDVPFEVGPSGVTLVPIKAGDHVVVSGDAGVRLGLASGSRDAYPDVITWQTEPAEGVLRVPTWSSARFLALRAEQVARARVRVATRPRSPLLAHRLDAEVYRWLLGERVTRPAGYDANQRRSLRMLEGLRRLVDVELAREPARRQRGAAGAVAHLLHAFWLNRRLMTRPLMLPFYSNQKVEPIGGEIIRERGDTREISELWRFARSSQVIRVEAGDADVVNFAIRARALGRSRVRIFSGDELVHDSSFRIPRRAEDPLRWTPARSLRVLTRAGRPIRLVVVEGSVRVHTRVWRANHATFDAPAAHRTSAHRSVALTRPAARGASGMSWLADLEAFVRYEDADARGRLERSLVPAPDVMFDAESVSARPRPPGAALIAYALLPGRSQHAGAGAQLLDFWGATRELPLPERLALRIALLEQVDASLATPIELAGGLAALRSSGDPERGSELDPAERAEIQADERVLSGLIEAVVSVRDGERSAASAHLEAVAATRADQGRFVPLAKRVWSRAAPWAALSAEMATARTLLRRPFDANSSTGLCPHYGVRGLRWWIVPRETTSFEVLDLGGTHTSVQFAPLHDDSPIPGEVQVAGQPVAVHPVLGEVSRVALRPGRHGIRHRRGGRVLARIPRLGAAPCSELRESERWYVLDGEVSFDVPDGPSATVASVIVDGSSLTKPGTVVFVEAGGEVAEASLRLPASGDIQIGIPAGVTRLRVWSDQLLLVRARVRLHPSAPARRPESRVRIASESTEPTAEIAALSRQLREAADASLERQLRARRAQLLHDLGYRRLAELDWTRAGLPGQSKLESFRGALFLPHRAEAVVPLGMAARTPLLPATKRPDAISRALKRRRMGRPQQALAALEQVGAGDGADEGALMVAHLASQLGETLRAASLFERLAHRTRSGALFEAAARQYDELATGSKRLDYTRRAFLLAHLAVGEGAAMGGFLHRYRDAVVWRTPSLASLGVNTLSVASSGTNRELSLGEQVRRALTLAPPDARFFRSESRFNLRRFRGETLQANVSCFSGDGPDEGCRAALAIDDGGLTCPPAAERGAASQTVAHVQRCSFKVPEHARELVVRLPAQDEPMGWALLQRLSTDDTSPPVPATWRKRYVRVSPHSPAKLQLTAPTVLRVDARRLGRSPGQLVATFVGPGAESLGGRSSLVLPAESDVRASIDSEGPVSLEHRQTLALRPPGALEVSLAADHGSVLLSPAVASIVRPPLPAQVAPASPRAVAAQFDRRRLGFGLTETQPARRSLPLSLSAELSVRDRDLADADEDARDRFAQAALVARKQLVPGRLWLQAGALSRARDGPFSIGASAALTLGVAGYWPGGFASARLVSQPELGASGALARLGLRHRIELPGRVNLLPELGVTLRSTETGAASAAGVDGDVYSDYAARRSRSTDAKLVATHRPFVDLLGRHALALRLNPDFSAVDRIEARGSLQMLPGRGLTPWLGLTVRVSHRAASPLRRAAFTRFQIAPAATLWHWLGQGQRLRSRLSLSLFVDAPNPTGSRVGLFVAWSFGYDFMLSSALDDFRVTQRPFRDRLEEGVRNVAFAPAPSDTYWQENPTP